MVEITKEKLFSLIPTKEKKALAFFKKRANYEDLVGDTILDVFLFLARPFPSRRKKEKWLTSDLRFQDPSGKRYDNFLEQWWGLRRISTCRSVTKSWKRYVKSIGLVL